MQPYVAHLLSSLALLFCVNVVDTHCDNVMVVC